MFRHATLINVKKRLKQNAEKASNARRGRLEIARTPQERVENWLRAQIGVQGSCKDFIEAHIAEKCQNRSDADRRLRWDFFMFMTYLLFLLLYSLTACSTNMMGKLNARNLIEAEVGNFDGVKALGEMHELDLSP